MKKVLFSISLMLTLSISYCQNPEFVDLWRNVSTYTTENEETSVDPSSYIWQDAPRPYNLQGLHIYLAENSPIHIYAEKNTAVFNFCVYDRNYFIHPSFSAFSNLSIKINNGVWQLLHGNGLTSEQTYSPDFGAYNYGDELTMSVKYLPTGSINFITREYKITIVREANHIYFDNYKNSISLYKGRHFGLSNRDTKVAIVVEGIDQMNTNVAAKYYHMGRDLYAELHDRGYKIAVLDFNWGGQKIQSNSAVLHSAIEFLSARNNNCDIDVFGVSMGALISRYTLAKAEDDGNPLPVRKYVSIDGPHRGAYISEDLQNLIKDNTDDFTRFNLECPAAMQLLKNNVFDSESTEHEIFFNELNSLNGDGYPHDIMTMTLSLGNGKKNEYYFEGGKWATVNVAGFISGEKLVFEDHDEQSGSFLPMSTTSFGTSIVYKLIGVEFERTRHPVFIPFTSSLDGEDAQHNNFGIAVHPKDRNHFHDEFPNDPKIATVLLSNISESMLWLQNKEENSIPRTYRSEEVKIGNNISSYIDPGDYTVKPSANVNIEAKYNIRFKPGVSISSGAKVSAKIKYDLCLSSPSYYKVQHEDKSEENYFEKEFNPEFSTNIYPNPSNGVIHVNLEDIENRDVRLILYNVLGATVYNHSVTESQIDLSNVQPGVYYAVIEIDGHTVTQKLVLN